MVDDSSACATSRRMSLMTISMCCPTPQKYGGGGIFNFYGISAAHHPTRTGKIYVHEFGHLLLGLGDEYVGTTSYDDMYARDVEPWEAT